MEHRPEKRDSDCYYGTGRRPETDKSHFPLIISLLVLMLAANLLTVAIHSYLREQDGAADKQDSEAETAASAVYPMRGNAAAQTGQAVLGMEVSELDESERRYWELPEGLIVRRVDAGGEAEAAGILVGDVILAVGDTAVTDTESFTAALARYAAGQYVPVTLYRSGERCELQLLRK